MPSIVLEPGATLYLFTDGYTDQKGGMENKKYMHNRFRALLQSVSNGGCAEQHQKLDEEFHSWKGESHQRDDVLIVGVKV
jgi:serine phosphatase RsbU (regulator of sigma subunit)